MDQRLEHIVDNFEHIKIGVDEPFRFGCRQCGKCCIHREDILLNAFDVYRLSKELQMQPIEMIREYCEVYIGDASRIPVVKLLPQGTVNRCRFLKDRKCSVHKAKPTVCAIYPIGRCIMLKGKNREAPDLLNAEIQYILDPPECGDKSETHTVREWLSEFGIPLDDPFFKKWHYVIAELRNVICRIEGKTSDDTVKKLWNASFALLYLEYDITQDFRPQFDRNTETLCKCLSLL